MLQLAEIKYARVVASLNMLTKISLFPTAREVLHKSVGLDISHNSAQTYHVLQSPVHDCLSERCGGKPKEEFVPLACTCAYQMEVHQRQTGILQEDVGYTVVHVVCTEPTEMGKSFFEEYLLSGKCLWRRSAVKVVMH